MISEAPQTYSLAPTPAPKQNTIPLALSVPLLSAINPQELPSTSNIIPTINNHTQLQCHKTLHSTPTILQHSTSKATKILIKDPHPLANTHLRAIKTHTKQVIRICNTHPKAIRQRKDIRARSRTDMIRTPRSQGSILMADRHRRAGIMTEGRTRLCYVLALYLFLS